MGLPVSASQIRTVLSQPALASLCPSGLNATPPTTSECPVSVVEGLAGLGVPQPHRVIATCAGQPLPVRAVRHSHQTAAGVDDLVHVCCVLPRCAAASARRGRPASARPAVPRKSGCLRRVGRRRAGLGFGVQPLGDGGVTLADRFVLLAHRHQRGHHRDHRQHRQRRDRPRPQPPKPPLLTQIITGQLIFGLAVNRGRQRGDLLPQRRRTHIPGRIGADIDEKRLHRQHTRLGERRHRRVTGLRIKPLPGAVPHQRPTG